MGGKLLATGTEAPQEGGSSWERQIKEPESHPEGNQEGEGLSPWKSKQRWEPPTVGGVSKARAPEKLWSSEP